MIRTQGCDRVSTLRVGPDGGIYMLSKTLDQAWRLVRRQTLR